VVIRVELAVTCEYSNREMQNSSFWVVHQLVRFPTHEDRSSVSFNWKIFLTFISREKSSQNRVFRKKLQIIIVI